MTTGPHPGHVLAQPCRLEPQLLELGLRKYQKQPLVLPREEQGPIHGTVLSQLPDLSHFSHSCWPATLVLPRALTQGDGHPALCAAVVLAVQSCLRADVQLVLGLVADFGTHTGLGDEVQALAVTAVIAPWVGKAIAAS